MKLSSSVRGTVGAARASTGGHRASVQASRFRFQHYISKSTLSFYSETTSVTRDTDCLSIRSHQIIRSSSPSRSRNVQENFLNQPSSRSSLKRRNVSSKSSLPRVQRSHQPKSFNGTKLSSSKLKFIIVALCSHHQESVPVKSSTSSSQCIVQASS